MSAQDCDVMPVMLIDSGGRWGRAVPFSALSEAWAYKNHGQTLKRLAERGGISACEAIAIWDRRKWAPMKEGEALEALAQKLDKIRSA